MSEFRFLHAADIHLDSPLKGLERYEGAPVEKIRDAVRHALSNLVQLAIDQQVAFVLIAGDLYDGDWKDHNTGLHFLKQLSRLHDAGISVYVISGNHDAESRMSQSLRWPQNPDGTPVLLDHQKPQTVRLPERDVAIHGRGFSNAKETANLVLEYPAAVSGCFNIGMLHTALNGADGHEPYAPCTTDDLHALKYQYWALGHVHVRDIRYLPNQTPVVYPGNLQGRHIRETGAKGCDLVTVDSLGNVTNEFQPLDVFRWAECIVDVSSVESLGDLPDLVTCQLQTMADEAEGRPQGVRVRLQGSTDIHDDLAGDPEHWTQEIRGCAFAVSGTEVWVEKVRFETHPLRDPSIDDFESGPMAELLSCMEEIQDDEGLLKELSGELEALSRKLPADLSRGEHAVIPTDADALKAVLKEVQPILTHRLQQKGGTT